MRKISYCFLFLLVFLGCGDESSNQDETVKDDIIVETGPEKEIVWEKDGQEMMLIPAGSFEMGDSKNEPEEWMADTRPLHTVALDAFYMDIHEVTVGQFKHFVTQTGYNYKWWDDVAELSPTDGHPMTIVKWTVATAYAEWAGKRLPTEAEWEYVARGGLESKRYPWGDDLSLATDYANYKGIGGSIRHQQVVLNLMDTDCTTWQEMSGNGVKIGMMKTTIVTHLAKTHQDRILVHQDGEFCGVVLGATLARAYEWLAATTTLRVRRTLTAGFDVWPIFNKGKGIDNEKDQLLFFVYLGIFCLC